MPVSPWQAPRPPLILASGSRARAQLLAQAGIAAEAVVSGVDETAIKRRSQDAGLDAGRTATMLAKAKATSVASTRPGYLTLGADQILSLDGAWFDKPASIDEARLHLRRQRGREVILHTAVVLCLGQTTVWSHLVEPRVRMREFSDDLLETYLGAEGDRLLECVGACRLEGPGMLLIERVEEEWSALLGLPMLALAAALRDQGVLLG